MRSQLTCFVKQHSDLSAKHVVHAERHMLRLRDREGDGRARGDGIGVVLGEVEEGRGWFCVFDPRHAAGGGAEDGAAFANCGSRECPDFCVSGQTRPSGSGMRSS